jgi:hypothetical protein
MVFEKNTVLLKVAETPVASDSREMYLPLVDIEYGMSTTDTVAYFTGVLDSNLYTYKLYYDTNDDDWALDSTVTPVSGGGAQVQADWTETDTSDPAYIQNKPATTGLIAGANITLTNGANGVTIAATVPTVPTTDQVYRSSSTNPQSGTAVAQAVSGKQNKLYSINDVRVVSTLPASPVSTTLYLIPET